MQSAVFRHLALIGVLGVAAVRVVSTGQAQTAPPGVGVLDEQPSIRYAQRPTTDPAAKLNEKIAAGAVSLTRDDRTGYLTSLLKALDVSVESQLLVFSKTGVQRAYISPRNPRALYYNETVAVGYVPGAPVIEIASHDPQQGVIFYTLDQSATKPALARRTSCLTCHVSESTLNIPGMLARSHMVGEDGNILPGTATTDVNHQTAHSDRWGGYYVTVEDIGGAYTQRAHEGNITFMKNGNTSNQVFVDFNNSDPERRGYLSASSDIAALLVFDHQMYGLNLLTRLNWDVRIAADGQNPAAAADIRRRVDELADYMLFVGEAPPLLPLLPGKGFAAHLEGSAPKDHLGRSFGQLDVTTRLMRYTCSYLIYSDAFNVLPVSVKSAVYDRMADILTGRATERKYARMTVADRRAILEILADTKPDFPKTPLPPLVGDGL